jgi:DNA-binding SARP family transcriptional activator
VRAVRGETVVGHFRTQKTAALLAFLAYPPGRGRSRDELIATFWPDDDLSSARHKLSVALSALRQQLDPEGLLLFADRVRVQLAYGQFTTDVAEFRDALADAEAALTDVARAAALARATGLYTGELLAGFYDDWIFPEQQQLAERFVQALRELVRLHERREDLPGALETALRAVAVDPLREELYCEAMRLQIALGEPAEALRLYRLLEHRLQEELEITPSSGARELARAARVMTEAPAPAAAPAKPAARPPTAAGEPLREPPGGAVPLGSPFYLERPADAQLREALLRQDSIVLIKGPRQVGKTSLLARGLRQARENGAAVASTDFQRLNADHLESADALLRALAEDLCEQLDLEVLPGEVWEARRGPSPNFRRYLRRAVFGSLQGPLVWGLDEVDRLFSTPYATEVFGLFRSWHNERALDPSGPWRRLTLAIAYATEAHLFITDMNQSPFNIGTRLELVDFTMEQVEDLNRRHGAPLRSAAEIEAFFQLLGGHPYLVRCGLHALAEAQAAQDWIDPLAWMEAQAECDEGLFAEHLRRILLLLKRDPSLCEAVREVLRGHPCPSLESFYRLRSAGVLSGGTVAEARPRSLLYARFLGRHLL